MGRSFRQGMLIGVLAPLACLAGVVYWVYHYTGRVPFMVSRPRDEELRLRLVAPNELGPHWRPWQAELEPALAKLCGTWQALKAQLAERRGM